MSISDIRSIQQTKQAIVSLQNGVARYTKRHNDHLTRMQKTIAGLQASLATHPDQDLVARVEVPGYHPSN